MTFIFCHIWDVILPIDELHHFSRWLNKKTDELLHHQPDEVFGKLRACDGLQLEISLHRAQARHPAQDFLWYGHDNVNPGFF